MICGRKAAVSAIRPMVRARVGAVVEGVGGPGAVEEEPRMWEEETDFEDEDGEAGARTTRKMVDPVLPSPDEVLEHNKTHLPFRNWCRHCARGRGVEMAHRTSKEESGLPELHLDFAFFGEEGEPGNTIPVLGARGPREGNPHDDVFGGSVQVHGDVHRAEGGGLLARSGLRAQRCYCQIRPGARYDGPPVRGGQAPGGGRGREIYSGKQSAAAPATGSSSEPSVQ